jgi:general secretion pathway protein D
VHRDIPVRTGNDPETVAKTDEIITQIIPIRFVEATQLVKDLSPLVSPQAMIVANEAGNSIAMTDTQANIRHMMEIIKAIDSSAEEETQLRVFPLKHADPVEMAGLLTDLFPSQTGTGTQAPIRFGSSSGYGDHASRHFGSFMSAMSGGGPPPSGSGRQRQRVSKRMQVVAVPDPRTSSVIVTATKDLMEQIAGMVAQLDFKSSKETKVRVFHLNNADPQEVLPMLQDMFQGNNASRNTRSGSQNSPLMNRVQQNQNSSSSSPSLGTGLGNSSRRSGVSGSSF